MASASEIDEDSLKAIQTNIVTLLESLETHNDGYSKSEMDNIQYNTTNILSKFHNNSSNLELGLQGILHDFHSGVLNDRDLEQILEAETQKGMYAIEVANKISEDLHMIFHSINAQFMNMRNGQPMSVDAMEEFVRSMDRSIGRCNSLVAVSSIPLQDAALSVSEISSARLKLTGDLDDGFFSNLLIQIAEKNKAGSIETGQTEDTDEGKDDGSDDSDTDTVSINSVEGAPEESAKDKLRNNFTVESAFLSRPPSIVKQVYGDADKRFRKKEQEREKKAHLLNLQIRAMGLVTFRGISIAISPQESIERS